MKIETYLRKNKLEMSTAVKKFLLGKEFNLFVTEEDDHIKNTFKSNKKEFGDYIYKFNYYLFVLILSIFLISPGYRSGLSIFVIIFGLKPLSHYLSLKNKVARVNITGYKKIKSS
ncbi:hypothetical protein [Lutibacter flavus]|uniref:Glycosyl-4,4'-diaponeurosporenoate acyltransferase n=1 Tax=Lutibacter flavus TaxID=691689 RepID=A0A238XI59_9FLAO|nr:hypothetical protein [Lutibacter flavus]SNR58382.1 hypothetical protein SAMN04488111_1830 [Lutibacter flavus]